MPSRTKLPTPQERSSERVGKQSRVTDVPKISRQESAEEVKTNLERISERSQVVEVPKIPVPGTRRGREDYPSYAHF